MDIKDPYSLKHIWKQATLSEYWPDNAYSEDTEIDGHRNAIPVSEWLQLIENKYKGTVDFIYAKDNYIVARLLIRGYGN